jgi:ornithine carbamoyltransferase
MTSEERFERIENTLQAAADTLKTLAQSQARTQEAITDMAASIGKYVDAAEARTRRLEENLDALIRAITAEHSNGKTKH